MARLGERIARLEASVRAAGLTEEARQQRELKEALNRVPYEVLSALDESLDAIERGEDPDTLVDPYELADERGRQALDALWELLAERSRGGESPSVDPPR
jgi:hypothetical protein